VATGGVGHNFMTETVDHFIFECLQLMVERGADTYYRNQAGRIILPSPFPPEVFWEMCQQPDAAKFVLRTPASLESAAW
jgi:hypothetical protein